MSAGEAGQKPSESKEWFNPATGGAPGTASVSTHICELCGPDKPVDQVWLCTLCIKPYCIKHLVPTVHMCFGAMGKPQKEAAIDRL